MSNPDFETSYNFVFVSNLILLILVPSDPFIIFNKKTERTVLIIMFKSHLHHYIRLNVYVRKHESQININCWIWKKDNHFLCVRERIDEKLLTKTEIEHMKSMHWNHTYHNTIQLALVNMTDYWAYTWL